MKSEKDMQKRTISERIFMDEAPETIAYDPDNPELTEKDFAMMRPFTEVFSDLAGDRKEGAIRLSQPVDQINEALRRA